MAIKHPRKEIIVEVKCDDDVYRVIMRQGAHCQVIVNPDKNQGISEINLTADEVIRYCLDCHIPAEKIIEAAEEILKSELSSEPELGGEG